MENAQVKLYLVDEHGNSPCFGIDETVEIEAPDYNDFQTKIYAAKGAFAYHLVANEGFVWSDMVGYDVAKNGKNYEIKASY